KSTQSNSTTLTTTAPPSTETTAPAKNITIPDSWVKNDSGTVSFYHPADWKLETVDESVNDSAISPFSSSVSYMNKNNVHLISFSTMKTSDGYSAVLTAEKADS